jgi:hypothetical protein
MRSCLSLSPLFHCPSPALPPPPLFAAIMSTDPAAQFSGVQEVRKLLSKEKDPPVLEVLRTNVLPHLLRLLTTGDEKMQFEVSWAVTNIASSEYTHTVVEAGAIPILCGLMASPSPEVREQCAWCLGNITGDGPAFRDMVLNTPGVFTCPSPVPCNSCLCAHPHTHSACAHVAPPFPLPLAYRPYAFAVLLWLPPSSATCLAAPFEPFPC